MTARIVFMTEQDARKFVKRPRRCNPTPGDLSRMRMLCANESVAVVVGVLQNGGLYEVTDRRDWVAVIVPEPQKLDSVLRWASAQLQMCRVETFDTTPPWVRGIRPRGAWAI